MNKDIKQFLSYIVSIFIVIILLTVWSNRPGSMDGHDKPVVVDKDIKKVVGIFDYLMDRHGVKKLYILKEYSRDPILGIYLTLDECGDNQRAFGIVEILPQCYGHEYGVSYASDESVKDPKNREVE